MYDKWNPSSEQFQELKKIEAKRLAQRGPVTTGEMIMLLNKEIDMTRLVYGRKVFTHIGGTKRAENERKYADRITVLKHLLNMISSDQKTLF